MSEVNPEMARVGARLKEARELAGMTQDDVVEALREALPDLAVKRPTVSNWEAGRNLPCLLQFRALCGFYGVLGFRIMYGTVPVDLRLQDAVELARLLKDASPSLRTKMDVMVALLRPAGADATLT
jgi:transcriptional regulator with XRE-family HTH domain